MLNQKGQSLVEFATFGTVLLVCLGALVRYGMQANYQQNLQMRNFRRALNVAYERTGPSAEATVQTVQDKAIPDPQDSWGFAPRSPITASASVTIDNNLQSLYNGDPADLPVTRIDINREQHGDAAEHIYELANYGTSGYVGSITMVLENPAGSPKYREINIPRSEIKVRHNQDPSAFLPEDLYAVVKIDGLVHKVTFADLDNDNELELVVGVEGSQNCNTKGYCGGVARWQYVDYQSGDIDSRYATISPWKGETFDQQQGLLDDYALTKRDEHMLERSENQYGGAHSTTTYYGDQETVHQVRTRAGVDEHTTTFEAPEAIEMR